MSNLKNLLTSAISAAMLFLPMGAAAQVDTAPDGYKLVWSDEFSGDKLNEDAWNIEVNGDGGGNQELQYYRRENVAVKDGNLVLTARRENYSGKAFTSGRITSRNKAYFKHGVLQARIKFPKTANGLWPAYWMMGNDMSKVGWPRCGEIDIIELGHANGIANGTQDRYFAGTLHYGKSASNEDHQQYPQDYTAPEDNAVENDDYHIFTVEWDGSNLNMYYDLAGWKAAQKRKARYFTCDVTPSEEVNSPGHYFQKPFFFLFNLAVGGTFPGIYNTDGITALPNQGDEAQMEVDWVRVYQAEDDADAQYCSPDSTNITVDPEPPLKPDSLTAYGYWGSQALDEAGVSTFDFANATDAVLIGTSQGVTEALSGSTVANYNVDDTKNFLWIWSDTYSALPSQGVNSFGFEEDFDHYMVNSVGWSGLGYASSEGNGKDLSMINDDYILHFGMRGIDPDAHVTQTITVGNAQFALCATKTGSAPLIGDFKRDGSWTYFDVPVTVLKSLAGGDLFTGATSYVGNVFAISSGGVAGTDLQFDNVFFYKNPNVPKGLPTEDNTTVMGDYATAAIVDGAPTFDFTKVTDAVLIGTSQGVTEALSAVTSKNYNVDEVNNFLYIWQGGDYQSLPSDGVNSFGWDEGYCHFVVGDGTWNGAGYASQNVGKDLSMIDDSYYLHFALRGTDVLQHASQTFTVGNAKFAIGDNADSFVPVLGDYRRNGDWYNFDIPVTWLRSNFGELFSPADNYMGNVFAVQTSNHKGNEVMFDNVFFYKTTDGAPVLPSYVSRSLDADGKTTFPIDSVQNVILIGTSQGVTEGFNGRILKDYNVDENKNFLYIWDGTYQAKESEGMNSFGYDEGYSDFLVGTVGWSGLGYASPADNGKDLSMIDDSYYLHFAMKGTGPESHYIMVGNAKFCVGATPFLDGATPVPMIGNYERDGEWYSFDIPFSAIRKYAAEVFPGAQSYAGNVWAILSGGVQGTEVQFDNIFFYQKGTPSDGVQTPTVVRRNIVEGIYTIDGRHVASMSRPGIYIVRTAQGVKKVLKR